MPPPPPGTVVGDCYNLKNTFTLEHLIEWLAKYDELNEYSRFFMRNCCKGLAGRVYEYVKNIDTRESDLPASMHGNMSAGEV